MGFSARRPAFILTLTAAAALALPVLSSHEVDAAQGASDPAAASPQFYTDHVQPIFQANCYRCHAGLNHRGGLHLDSPAGILHGGKDGVVIVPGHPDQSLMVSLIRHEGPAGDPMPMPPKSKLSDSDIATITEWIQAGAPMPAEQPPVQ